MRTLIVLPALILALTAANLSARALSLPQALQLAVDHSSEVKRARAEEQAAEAGIRAAQSSRFPTLDATAVAFYNDDIASFELDSPLGSIAREIGSKEHYQTDLRLFLPLYTGGRISAGISAAEASRDYRQALADAQVQEVVFLTRVEYLTLYRADREIASAAQSLRRAQLIYEDVTSLYDAGAADSVDLLEADLAVTEATYRLEQATHQRRSSEIRLLDFLGLSPDEQLKLTIDPPDPIQPSDLPEQITRPELRAAMAAVDIGFAETRRTRADFFPTLAVYGGYSYGKPNLDFFNNTWNDYWTVGGKLTWSFNLGFQTKHKVIQSARTVKAARHRQENLSSDLRRERDLSFERWQLAWETYESARQRFEITTRNYALAQAKHDAGALGTNRLLEIEANLTRAEADLAAAATGFYIAQSAYFYAVGSDRLTEGL